MTILEEWVENSEGSFQAALTLNRPCKKPLLHLICFYCRQCVEKYLTTLLIHYGATPSHTRELEELIKPCAVHEPDIILFQPHLHCLNNYGFELCYPGKDAAVPEAQATVQMMRDIRKFVRKSLGL